MTLFTVFQGSHIDIYAASLQPEIGPRVVYLIVKSNMTEENAIGSLMTEEPRVVDEDDVMTLSSAASDSEPYWRRREYIVQLEDESVRCLLVLFLLSFMCCRYTNSRHGGR